MTAEVNATGSVEATTTLLQAELPQLEKQQAALQAELAVVSDRLESVRGALTALSALSATTLPRPRTAESEQVVVAAEQEATETAPAPAEEVAAATAAGPSEAKPARGSAASARKRAASKTVGKQADKRRTAKKPATAKTARTKPSPEPEPEERTAADGTGLTDQVLTVLNGQAGTALRARDVAHAIGRDGSAGNINTVRSTLDRLVATSRVHRAGRGLYEAVGG
ncbi:hypothetical protein ABZ532_20450 [Streptomyces sp. NPDC019396]|uniref:hypothetical protein n=1 Tax=Streptomyces sp. NPDC019396 TaxID=3154687 RepID=UPI0033C0506E